MEKRSVVVSNLPSELREEDIRGIFGEFGVIEHLVISDVGDSKTCRIDYPNEVDAAAAEALNNMEFGDKTIRVMCVPTTRPESTLSDAKSLSYEDFHAPPAEEEVEFAESATYDPLQDQVARTVYVGNLAPGLNTEDLKVYFSSCGEVLIARITDAAAGRFGFLEFDSVDAAHTAYKLHGTLLAERNIAVRSSNNCIMKTPAEQEMINKKLMLKRGLATEEELLRGQDNTRRERTGVVTEEELEKYRLGIVNRLLQFEKKIGHRVRARREKEASLLREEREKEKREREREREREERALYRGRGHREERDWARDRDRERERERDKEREMRVYPPVAARDADRPSDIRGGDVRPSRDRPLTGRDAREARDVRDVRDIRDTRDVRDGRDRRDIDGRDARDTRDLREPRHAREVSARDGRDRREARAMPLSRDRAERDDRDLPVATDRRDGPVRDDVRDLGYDRDRERERGYGSRDRRDPRDFRPVSIPRDRREDLRDDVHGRDREREREREVSDRYGRESNRDARDSFTFPPATFRERDVREPEPAFGARDSDRARIPDRERIPDRDDRARRDDRDRRPRDGRDGRDDFPRGRW